MGAHGPSPLPLDTKKRPFNYSTFGPVEPNGTVSLTPKILRTHSLKDQFLGCFLGSISGGRAQPSGTAPGRCPFIEELHVDRSHLTECCPRVRHNRIKPQEKEYKPRILYIKSTITREKKAD